MDRRVSQPGYSASGTSDKSEHSLSTTTISTVAVQAGRAKIVLAILKVSFSMLVVSPSATYTPCRQAVFISNNTENRLGCDHLLWLPSPFIAIIDDIIILLLHNSGSSHTSDGNWTTSRYYAGQNIEKKTYYEIIGLNKQTFKNTYSLSERSSL